MKVRRGFTLVEIMVVMTIIGTLAVVAVSIFLGAQRTEIPAWRT